MKGDKEFRAEDPTGYTVYLVIKFLAILSAWIAALTPFAAIYGLFKALIWITPYIPFSLPRFLAVPWICLMMFAAVGMFVCIFEFVLNLRTVVVFKLFVPYFKNLEKTYPCLKTPRNLYDD